MINVIDGFSPYTEGVRQSALAAGFGSWRPSKGEVGSSVYDGMCFWGDHSPMIYALTRHLNRPIYPNSMFFRVTLPETEGAYIHSDREAGQWTCIVYCSEHPERTGTAFYKHREFGLTEMPSFDWLRKQPHMFDILKKDMVEAQERRWEQLDFIRGQFNRGLIFNAPLFHARYPAGGLGDSSETGRMVWVCHFNTEMGD